MVLHVSSKIGSLIVNSDKPVAVDIVIFVYVVGFIRSHRFALVNQLIHYKTSYGMESPIAENKIEISNLKLEDYLDLKESMLEAYKTWGAYWREHHIQKLLEIFPQGQIVIKVNGKVVGTALSIIVDYARFGDNHTYEMITGNYTFSTHDPKG